MSIYIYIVGLSAINKHTHLWSHCPLTGRFSHVSDRKVLKKSMYMYNIHVYIHIYIYIYNYLVSIYIYMYIMICITIYVSIYIYITIRCFVASKF